MIYEIKCPILGFEKIKKVDFQEIDETFAKVTDCSNPNISFTVVNPFLLRDYDMEIPKNCQNLLEIDESSQISVYCVMVMQNPIQNSTINFLAPIVFNQDKKFAGQIILDGIQYKEYSIAEKIANYLSKA